MAFNNTMALSASQVSRDKTADVTALFQLAQTFAGALGTAIAAVLLNQAPDTTSGVHNVFSLLLLLVTSNFIFYYFLFRAIHQKKAAWIYIPTFPRDIFFGQIQIFQIQFFWKLW